MSTEGAEPKAEMPELDLWGSGRNPRRHGIESASRVTVGTEPRNAAGTATMEAVVSRENMLLALHAVERNRGAAGVDGMTTGQLRGHLRQQWEQIKAHLLEGSYQPQLVRRVDIPKPGGGTRMLGIPTVMDRLIQQALHQVMSPVWEPDFSEHSYGFRPGRGAHGAVEAARAHVEAGHRWVVDLDLEKFLDAASYYTLVHAAGLKSDGWLSRTLIKRPFCRPRLTCRAGSSPRLTRCITVCRDTRRRRMASGIGT